VKPKPNFGVAFSLHINVMIIILPQTVGQRLVYESLILHLKRRTLMLPVTLTNSMAKDLVLKVASRYELRNLM
jgi:hypothetical protein